MKSSALKRHKKLTPLDYTRYRAFPSPTGVSFSLLPATTAAHFECRPLTEEFNIISCRYHFCCNVPTFYPPTTISRQVQASISAYYLLPALLLLFALHAFRLHNFPRAIRERERRREPLSGHVLYVNFIFE